VASRSVNREEDSEIVPVEHGASMRRGVHPCTFKLHNRAFRSKGQVR